VIGDPDQCAGGPALHPEDPLVVDHPPAELVRHGDLRHQPTGGRVQKGDLTTGPVDVIQVGTVTGDQFGDGAGVGRGADAAAPGQEGLDRRRTGSGAAVGAELADRPPGRVHQQHRRSRRDDLEAVSLGVGDDVPEVDLTGLAVGRHHLTLGVLGQPPVAADQAEEAGVLGCARTQGHRDQGHQHDHTDDGGHPGPA
jgi:hypothetical protein